MAGTNHTMKFITGLIFGGLAGVAAAMLYAPQSGDETREMIRNTAMDASVRTRDTLRQAQEQVAHKAEEVQQRVGSIADETRRKASRLKDVGSEMVNEQRSNLEEGLDEAQDVVNS